MSKALETFSDTYTELI